MARVTVEDCLERVVDQFALVHLASQRYRQLHRGAERLVDNKNKNVVCSLREIAAGRVRFREDIRETLLKTQRKLISQRLQMLIDMGETTESIAAPTAASTTVDEDIPTPLI